MDGRFGTVSLILLALVAATSTACGPKRVTVNGVEMSYEQGATLVYQQGQKAKTEGDLETARARFKEVIDLFDGSDAVPNALAELGTMQLAQLGCPGARVYLERLVDEYASHPRSGLARQKLEACKRSTPVQAAADEPLTPMRLRFEEAGSPAERKEVASEAADRALDADDFDGAVKWLLRVRELETDSARRAAIEGELAELIDTKVSFRGIRQLVESVPGKEFPKELLVYKLGRIQYHTRDLAGAQETLRSYVADWPSGTHVGGARDVLARIDALANVKPRTVGVVLPLSGKHRPYGELALQAIQLAVNADKNGKGGRVELAVRDTKSERAGAAQAVEDLVLKDGAIVILGPIFTYAAESAAAEAQKLGVPIVTISTADDIDRMGPYVFRNGLTNRRQIQALVQYAMDILGMRTFAILHPRHPYGEELLDLFWDEVEAKKGEIRGVESYATDETTFTAPVKKLVARDILDMRTDYRRAIEDCNKQPDSYRKARCRERAVKDLKPIVDFDGLFIPDYPQSISMISAALAFEDIIVEQDARRLRIIEKTLGRKVKPVTLLGASGWNAPVLPERAGRNVENAIFTDGFFAEAEDKLTAEYVEAYKRRYSRVPRLYPEALLTDSARIVMQAMDLAKPTTREDMRLALRQIHDFPGVTGKTSFARGTDAEKTVKILSIRDGKIVEVPPPDAAAPASIPAQE